MFVSASKRLGDSEFDHFWGGRSGEGSIMLQDQKLPNDPEDQTSLTTPTGTDLSTYIQGIKIVQDWLHQPDSTFVSLKIQQKATISIYIYILLHHFSIWNVVH